MSMFGYDTPKERLWEAFTEHAKEVGPVRAIADLGDVLRCFMDYEAGSLPGYQEGYDAAMQKVAALTGKPA